MEHHLGHAGILHHALQLSHGRELSLGFLDNKDCVCLAGPTSVGAGLPAVGQPVKKLDVPTSSQASLLPQGTRVANDCGSWLACEGGVSGDEIVVYEYASTTHF